MSTDIRHNASGNYRFLNAEARPFSSGAVTDPGFDISRVTFARPIPLEQGIAAAARHVSTAGRPVGSIAGFELRIPKPLSQTEFDTFNRRYVATLHGISLGLDGVIPATRTNVAPTLGTIREPSVFGFTFTIPSSRKSGAFILSGVTEEIQGSAAEMLSNIAGILAARARRLESSLVDSTTIQLYADAAPESQAFSGVEREFGEGIIRGMRWFPSLPPIEGRKFEIDAQLAGLRNHHLGIDQSGQQAMETVQEDGAATCVSWSS